MGLIWRTFNHARYYRRSALEPLLQIRKQCYSSGPSNTKGRPGISRNRFVWAFFFAGISLYTIHEYFGAENDQEKRFQPYLISEKEFYSISSSIFKLKPQQKVDWSKQWRNGLWSVEIKQPQLQIAREYTPLPNAFDQNVDGVPGSTLSHQDPGALEFWIRREPRGEVSNYLHNLNLNDSIEVRGPKSQTVVPEAEEFLFVAGGTGIAPAIQLAHLLLSRHERSDNLPKVSILWANRSRQDCSGGVSDDAVNTSPSFISRLFSSPSIPPTSSKKAYLVSRLDSLKKAFDGKLRVNYYVDEEDSRIDQHDILSRLKTGKDNVPYVSKRVVIVCGPDGFVAHFAGPKTWYEGRQIQGDVTGVLQVARNLGWDVIKL